MQKILKLSNDQLELESSEAIAETNSMTVVHKVLSDVDDHVRSS